MISKKALFIADILLLCVIFSMVQHAVPGYASETFITASVTVTPLVESYGASVAGSFGVSSSDAALGEPDGSGATMRRGGWLSIELRGMLTGCTDISIWAAKGGGKFPGFNVYVSADGSSWTQVGSGKCTSRSYTRYDFSGAFGDVQYIKVSHDGSRSAKMLLDAVLARATEVTKSYGASVAVSFGISSSDAALGEPDGSGATMRGGGWLSIELTGMLTNCTNVSLWAAKSGGKSPGFNVYVSADGSSWTQAGSGSCTSESYTRYDFSGAFGDVMYIKVSRNGPTSAKMLLDAVWAKRQ